MSMKTLIDVFINIINKNHSIWRQKDIVQANEMSSRNKANKKQSHGHHSES